MRFPTWKEVESDPEFQSLEPTKKKEYFGKWSKTAVDRAMQQGLYRDEEFASGFTGWYNQKAKEYGEEEEVGDFQQLSTRLRQSPKVGTSFIEEVTKIPAAIKSAVDQPLEAFGETAEVLGAPALAQTLKGAVEAPKDYKTAAESFMRPEEGEFQVAGFAPQYIPRAIVEQAGQLAGAVATRVAGGAIGGAVGAGLGSVVPGLGTAAGAATGTAAGVFTGPAVFEMAQIVGPVAKERAKNNGRTEPTNEDLAWAWTTAGTSGALNAIGAKYIPGGEKLVGGLAKKIAASIVGEGLTESGQSVAQQTGETIFTEKGIEVSPKEAIAEGIIGGAAGGAATAVFERADKKPEDPTKAAATKAAADELAKANQAAQELSANNAPLTAKVIQDNAAKDFSAIAETEENVEEAEKFAPPAEAITREELKTQYATLSDKELVEAESTFREDLESEDAETRSFAQSALNAIAEVKAEKAPIRKTELPTDVLPTETPAATYGREAEIYDVFAGVRQRPPPPSGPAFESAQVIEQELARAERLRQSPEGRAQLRSELQGEQMTGEVRRAVEQALATTPEVAEEGDVFAEVRRPTEVAPEEPVAPVEPTPVAPAEVETAASLSRVANNTATDEEVVRLARQGLVNIQEGQNVITPRGEEVMQRGGAPLPRLTPEERAAEVAAAPVPAAIVEQEPVAPAEPAPSQVPAEKISPIESFKSNIKNKGVKYLTYSDFRKTNKAEDWESEGGVKIDESYYPTAVIGDTSVAFTTNGLSLINNKVNVSYESDTDSAGNKVFTIERIVTKEGKRGKGGASKALSEVTKEADNAGLTLQLEPAAVSPLIKKGGKGLTNKQLVDWYKRNGFVQKFEGSDKVLIREPKGAPPAAVPTPVTTPPVTEAVTPAPEAAPTPAGISVGNRVKTKTTPQSFVVEEVLPQSAREAELGEQYYSIRNERTGEVQTVEANDIQPIKAKKPPLPKKQTRGGTTTFDFTPRAALPTDQQLDRDTIIAKAQEAFEGVPAGRIEVVNDPAPEGSYGYIAAYNPNTNKIEINQAYYTLEDNIGERISHELGHYLYQDPRWQKAFARLYKRLTPKSRQKLDAFIEQAYSDYESGDRNEEANVRAFDRFLNDAKDNRNIFRKFLGEILDFITDALSIFSPYFKTLARNPRRLANNIAVIAAERFKSGEVIEGVDTTIAPKSRAAEEMTQMDRDYLAAVERGDMETAQRMVDEAAMPSEQTAREIFNTLLWFNEQRVYPDNFSTRSLAVRRAAERGEDAYDFQRTQGSQPWVSADTTRDESQKLGEWLLSNNGKLENINSREDVAIPPVYPNNEYSRSLRDGVVAYSNYRRVSDDPVTYDDAGNVIPLSQRFQPARKDIRYAREAAEPTTALEAVAEEAPAERVTRRTKMQNIVDISTGVKRPRTKLTVDEMAALKDQIRIGARKRREDKQTQKEFAKDVTEYLRGMAIRGKVSAPQLRAITSKAMQTQFDNEASIKGFLNYANKVIENANYNRDISEAKAAIKRARQLADQKKGSPQTKAILASFGVVDPKEIEPENMDERDVEVDGVIVREKPISVAEFTSVLKEYMKAFAPVTAEGYVVIPDAEMVDFLSKVGAQIKQNQDATKNIGFDGELAEIADKTPKQIEEELARDEERRKRIENKVNKLAEAAQIGLAKYDNPDLNADEKDILDFMKRATLSDMDLGNRKDYIRIANDILVNNKFFGAEKFASIAEGQIGAAEAARDSKTIKRNDALIKGYYQLFGEETGREIALGMQSLSDTLRNITRPEEGVRLLYQMGFGKLERGRAAANSEKRKFTDAMDVRLKQIEKKTGQSINDGQGLVSSGVAATLIQTAPDETQAEGIQRMRGLIEADIERKKNSWRKEDRMTAALVEQALKEVYADSVDGILANLKKTHPANYEVLTFLMDTVLPSYKPLFKQHDEMFNNQTDNYDNPFYLPIKYRRVVTEPVDPAEGIGNRMQSVASPKQSVNSIKRVKNTVLPENMQFDYNLIRNVIDSVASQLDAAYMNPGLQQVHAFLTSENAAKALGGAENLEIVRRRINSLAESRDRKSYDMTGWSRVFDTLANGVRNISTTMLLGGIGQVAKQAPAQMLTTVINVNDASITGTAAFEIKAALPVMQQFSIGERGEIAGGARWINQLDTGYSKLERYIESGLWSKVKDVAQNLGDVWLAALKKSDSVAAGHGWISYYKKYLKDNNIPFTNWDNEARLVAEGDRDRVQAGLYADTQIEIYQGASDPTKMATFAQRGKSGAENMMKTIFLPFSSFAIQERTRFLSDLRDATYGSTEEKKRAAKGLASTIAGIATFHWVRRYVLPFFFGYLAYGLYGMLGVEMEEPDEEKEKEMKDRTFKKFLGELAANITVGGYSSLAENAMIDAVNMMAYEYDKLNENENVMTEDGEIMSWETYQKKRAPFYRYTGPGADTSLGMFDVIPDQLKSVKDKLADLSDEELMDSLTEEEKRVLILAGFSDILYTLRLNDTDVARMINKMSKDVKTQAEEREKEQRKLMRMFQ